MNFIDIPLSGVGTKKAKASAQASGFCNGYTGASRNNSGKGLTNAKAGTIQAMKKAILESDPIGENENEDIDMEEYSEEGAAEGGRGKVKVIDVGAFATSLEDEESLPCGDEVEVS